jgi:hypothetical protein
VVALAWDSLDQFPVASALEGAMRNGVGMEDGAWGEACGEEFRVCALDELRRESNQRDLSPAFD